MVVSPPRFLQFRVFRGPDSGARKNALRIFDYQKLMALRIDPHKRPCSAASSLSASRASRSTSSNAIVSRTFCGNSFLAGWGGFGINVSVSPISNQTKWQLLHTSTLTAAFSDRSTSIIGLRQPGQNRLLAPSPLIACFQSGLIDSGVKIRRNNSTVMARPAHRSQPQNIPFEVRICSSGRLHVGQIKSESFGITMRRERVAHETH